MSKLIMNLQLALTGFGLLVMFYNIYELISQKYSTSQGIIFVVEALVGLILIYLPNVIKMYFRVQFPPAILFFYWFFLVISVFAGTCLHLISIISFWDKVLHTISPMLLTVVGYGLIATLLKNAKIEETSPWLFLIFGFAFAGVCGIFWEFWEFFCDQFFGMNLQRFAATGGSLLIGRAALMDTMGDLFTNTAGAIVVFVLAYMKSRGNPNFFKQFKIKRGKPRPEPEEVSNPVVQTESTKETPR